MDINDILNGVECSCGKSHKCDIEYIFIEKNAIERLSVLCKSYSNILIIADENTFGAAGEKTTSVLCDKNLKKVIFDGTEILIPDEKAIKMVRDSIENIDIIIGIGSGVIQDLCKYVAFFEGLPYMVVATAPSMDGYTSDGAAMILNGMKETVKARLPKAIVADICVLKEAPMEMIKAGYGDIIGKYSALNDWKLSMVINDEYFCQYIYDTTYQMIENTLNTAKGLLRRDEDSIKTLTEALMIVGIMMSFATSSRPASGSEHHLSHFFEIVGILNNEPYFAHGIDVAYSTVITAQIRENILKKEYPDKLYRQSESEYTNEIQRVYKSVADDCIALQEKVGNYNLNRYNAYVEKKNEISDILSEMPSAEEIKSMLMLAEIDMSEFYRLYSDTKLADAIKYAKELKDRYTVLWMNYDLFGGRI